MLKSTGYPAVVMGLALIFSVTELSAQSQSAPSNGDPVTRSLLIAFGVLFIIIILVLNNVIRNLAGNHSIWKPKPPKSSGGAAALLLLFISSSASAVSADAPVFGVFQGYSLGFWTLVIADLCLILVIAFQLRIFRKLIGAMSVSTAAEEVEEVVAVDAEPAQKVLWWKQVMIKLTRTVPVEKEEEVMTEHEYDGIRELDNVLPPWWVAMFYVTIIFSGAYLAHYHLFKTGDLQLAEYHNSVEQAEREIEAYMATVKAQVDENSVTLVTDASLLSEGEKIYQANCVACHGAMGEGGVGPNFVDEYWLHGGSVNDIFSVIKYGVPSKGMISWKAQLSPTQIQNVSSYLLTFQGTNPPNLKEPQGELYTREDVDTNDETAPANVDSLHLSMLK